MFGFPDGEFRQPLVSIAPGYLYQVIKVLIEAVDTFHGEGAGFVQGTEVSGVSGIATPKCARCNVEDTNRCAILGGGNCGGQTCLTATNDNDIKVARQCHCRLILLVSNGTF